MVDAMLEINLVTHSEKHEYGFREIWGTVEVSQIRSCFFSGFGSATKYYECLTENGWKRFKKKDQVKGIQKRLPVIESYPHKEDLWDERSPYTKKLKFISDPVTV